MDMNILDIVDENENIIGEDCKSVNMEDIDYNNINWIKVYLHGTFVGSDEPTYITYDGAQMYTLSFICDNQDFIDYTLNNFSSSKGCLIAYANTS